MKTKEWFQIEMDYRTLFAKNKNKSRNQTALQVDMLTTEERLKLEGLSN
jgi:hypothetical protein